MSIRSVNPATGAQVASYDEMSRDAVGEIIGRTHETFLAWRRTSFEERARAMRSAAQILRTEAEALARLMALEMGKPLRDGIAEAQKCATCCDYYADNAERPLAPELVKTEARSSFVTFNPLGVEGKEPAMILQDVIASFRPLYAVKFGVSEVSVHEVPRKLSF